MTQKPNSHVSTFLERHGRRAAIAVLAALALSACNTGTSLTDGLAVQPRVSTGTTGSARPSGELTNRTALAAEERQIASTQTQGAIAGGQEASLPPELPPVAFLPVTGAPRNAVNTLAGAMRQAAQQQSLPVVVSVDQGAQYQVKGYFSALNENSTVTLVYVWDVLDRSGSRIHRISGQERGGRSSSDPWDGITEDVISRVAQRTMGELRSWMARSRAG